MPVERSAGAVVFRKDGEILYLVLEYGHGHWGFPKGKIETGEDMEETVKREIQEETGISRILFVPNFKEKISYFYKKEGKTIYKEVVFFLVEGLQKKVTLSFEHSDYAWLKFEDAQEKVNFKNDKIVLEKAHKMLGK